MWVGVGLEDTGNHRISVEANQHAPRVVISRRLKPGPDGVVQDGDDGIRSIVSNDPSVVLAGEVALERKVALFPSEPPKDCAVLAGDLVQSVGVSAAEQVVAIRELVDGICVSNRGRSVLVDAFVEGLAHKKSQTPLQTGLTKLSLTSM